MTIAWTKALNSWLSTTWIYSLDTSTVSVITESGTTTKFEVVSESTIYLETVAAKTLDPLISPSSEPKI